MLGSIISLRLDQPPIPRFPGRGGSPLTTPPSAPGPGLQGAAAKVMFPFGKALYFKRPQIFHIYIYIYICIYAYVLVLVRVLGVAACGLRLAACG